MATHLRIAAVTWLVAAPAFGAGVATAAPHEMPLSPGISADTSGDSSGTSHPGLPSIGDLRKAFGGLTTTATAVGTGTLNAIGITPSAGQQLAPKFGNGRTGVVVTSGTPAPNAPAGQPSAVVATTQSSAVSESENVAETPAAAPSVPAVAAPLVQATVMAVQAAVVVADAPMAPVTALTGPLPPVLSEPIQSVAALPGFAVAQALPVVNGLTAAATTLSSTITTPVPGATRAVSFERGFGAHVSPPASGGPQLNSRFAGHTGAAGDLPARGPEPTDRVFAADHTIVAAPEFRPGYSDDLRAAGLGEVAAVAVPGFTGLLVLTGAGGLIGFRQARAGRAMHGGTLTRFAGR